jgi:hypothetical protein
MEMLSLVVDGFALAAVFAIFAGQLSTTKIRPLITPTRSRVGNGNAASIRACVRGGA